MSKSAIEKILESIKFQIEDEGERETFVNNVARALIKRLDSIDAVSSDESLIEYLMAKGLFPTFAFPLDVAVFEAKGTKKKKENSKFSEPHIYARTSQDLKVALSEYAPGRKIVINKQSFLINGIGKSFPEDPINHMSSEDLHKLHYDKETGEIEDYAEDWKFYNRCISENCGVVFQSTDPGFAYGDDVSCKACISADREPNVTGTRIITPEVFRPLIVPHEDGRALKGANQRSFTNSSEIEMKAEDDSDDAGVRTRTSSAKLPTPLNDSESEAEEKTLIRNRTGDACDYASIQVYMLGPNDELFEGTRLLITNNGPSEEGFDVCSKCGYVPTNGKFESHHRPYAITRDDLRTHVSNVEGLTGDEFDARVKELSEHSNTTCSGLKSEAIILGHEFRTDVIIFRVPVKEPLTTDWSTNAFHSGLKAIREALITETTNVLNLVEREISGNYRKVTLTDNEGKLHMYIDFFLYDSASGGAGLVRQINSEFAEEIFEAVEKRLEGRECTGSKPCQRVCTGCLLDFRNQVDQESMSRVLGHQMFQFFKSGTKPDFKNNGYKSGESDQVGSLIDILDSVYTNFTFEKLPDDVISVKNNNDEVRKFEMQSILCGTMDKEERILWGDTPSRIEDLEDSKILIPYELLRDAPHMCSQILFPSPPVNDTSETSLGGGWLP